MYKANHLSKKTVFFGIENSYIITLKIINSTVLSIHGPTWPAPDAAGTA